MAGSRTIRRSLDGGARRPSYYLYRFYDQTDEKYSAKVSPRLLSILPSPFTSENYASPGYYTSPDYHARYDGNMSQIGNDFSARSHLESQHDRPQTPGLVQELAGSSQTNTSLPLLTPPPFSTDYSFHRLNDTTGISPVMERVNLGFESKPLAYHDCAGTSPSKGWTVQEEVPRALFHTEAYRLDDIKPGLPFLHQFSEIGASYPFFEPGQTLPPADMAGTTSDSGFTFSGRQSDDGYVTGLGATRSPSGFDLSNDIFSPEYFSTAPRQLSGDLGNSFMSCRGPSSLPDIGHTMFEQHAERFSALHLQMPDEGVIKTEGASVAHRNAVDRRRWRPRKYICNICGDGVTSMQNLKNHINSHKQVHPYKCSHCPEKRYRHTRSLNRHMKKEHQSNGQEKE